MARRPFRPLFLVSAAALAPIALGVAMHLDHVAAAAACTADLATWTATTRTTARVETVVPQTLPVPVPMMETHEHALPFAYVVDIDGPHIVISTTVDESWGLDAPELRPSVGKETTETTAWRSVSWHRLPISALATAGRMMRVYSSEGEACTARVGGMALVAEWSGDRMQWDPDTGEAVLEPLAASEIWDAGRRLLVAPLEIDGDCGTPLWARDVALPAPAVFVRTAGAVPRAARKAVLRDPKFRELAREFAAFVEGTTDLPRDPTLAQDTIGQRWHDARGRELFTFSISGDGFGSCGGFDPAWATFVPTGAAGVTALDTVGDDVIAVFDLERDGRIEVLTSSWLGSTRLVEIGTGDGGEDAQLTERASLEPVPFFGCPC